MAHEILNNQDGWRQADSTKETFITTTSGMSGHFAVMLWWNPDMEGFWEPYDTGIGRYLNQQDSIS